MLIGELTLHIKEKNVPVIEAFLFARFQYNIQVPFHRTRGGYDVALKAYITNLDPKEHSQKFVEVNENNEITTVDFNFFEDFDDYHMFELIKKDAKLGNKWANILLRKDHLSPVLDLDRARKDGQDKNKVNRFITKLKDKKFIENEDFFRYRQPLKLTKLIKTVDEKDSSSIQMDKRVYVVNKDDKKIMPFIEYSIFSSFAERPIDILRIYVTSEKHQEAKEILNQLEYEIKRESDI